MKKFCITVMWLLCTIAAFSADLDKEFKKMIEKFDVPDSAKVVPANNPVKFWQTTLYSNEPMVKFLKDIKKNRGAEKEALRMASELPRFYPQYDESIIEGLQGFCDTLLMDMGISSLPIQCSLHVIYSDEVNSFNALTEDSFAICLTSGLLNRKGMTREILIGIIANEFTHGALQHRLRGLYSGAKERRKNELSASIASGLNAFASGFEAGLSGNTQDRTYNYLLDKDLKDKAKTSTAKYVFDYTKEQEYEADIVAFRFIEYMFGNGEDYLNALRIIGSVYNHLSSDVISQEDIITASSRINFIKYVQQHPELGNKINASMRNSRERDSRKKAEYKMSN
ncbi:MAG: M48 family metalloprotease [Barnesiella sp.]|nr:M48 family metalloprotease [Barnesiella sp.]